MCLAVPGRIASVTEVGVSRVGRVEFGGVVREALLDFVPEAQPGDYVLVHVGVAISRVDSAEAERTLALMRELGEAAEEGGE